MYPPFLSLLSRKRLDSLEHFFPCPYLLPLHSFLNIFPGRSSSLKNNIDMVWPSIYTMHSQHQLFSLHLTSTITLLLLWHIFVVMSSWWLNYPTLFVEFPDKIMKERKFEKVQKCTCVIDILFPNDSKEVLNIKHDFFFVPGELEELLIRIYQQF